MRFTKKILGNKGDFREEDGKYSNMLKKKKKKKTNPSLSLKFSTIYLA